MGGPFAQRLRAELSVESQRRLIPVQNRPFHSSAIARERDTRKLGKKPLANASAAVFRLYEEVFKIETGLPENVEKL